MPELPEVETTRRGIRPQITGRTVTAVTIRQRQLRWPISPRLDRDGPGRRVEGVDRRAKYLLIRLDGATLIVHLGMSGSLRIVPQDAVPRRHDHVDIHFDDGRRLRYHDPRRFGAMLWTTRDPARHPLLAGLGPEPLSDAFTGAYLHERARGRRAAVKSFIMDGRIVVGVGNIYANEALFAAGIHPRRAAGRIARERYEALAGCIRDVLANAIQVGGTTLRDFVGGDGAPGYFARHLKVYGRDGEPCPRCRAAIRQQVTGQRASYYCPACQR